MPKGGGKTYNNQSSPRITENRARRKHRPTNPDQAIRQQTHLRASQTIPNLQIIYGHFLSHNVMMPLDPPRTGYVKVIKTRADFGDVVGFEENFIRHGVEPTVDSRRFQPE